MPSAYSLLERNLEALAGKDLSLAGMIRLADPPAKALVVPSQKGLPTLIVNGVSLHSRFDPEAEAQAWLDSEEVQAAMNQGLKPVVFGLGLGYHVLALTNFFKEVVVIELEAAFIRLAFSHLDFSAAMSNLEFLTRPEPGIDWSRTLLMPHAPSVRLKRDVFNSWVSLIKSGRRTGRETAAQLKADLRNLPGLGSVLSGFEPGSTLGLPDLALAIRKRQGPLSEGEIYVLLMQELA
ncbi:MAG: hypothetical protein V1742_11000 [Pseudomonadota bacterium]